ncbi:MAG: laccase domain-containing protein [Verrucomicrobiae bacterium]|nr:laccase domain-containing protein [Verrucomicrobiae bacterium]
MNSEGHVQFPELLEIPWIRHAFLPRQPGVSVSMEKPEVLKALRQRHTAELETLGIPHREMASAEQVHGNGVRWLDSKPSLPSPDVDGLATRTPGLPLGIYVADCCAVYLVDTDNRAIALLHSGLKGTRANISKEGVSTLREHAQSDPGSILAVLSPCIRGCCYREEFANAIVDQLRAEGIHQIARHDECTACDEESYYSYHREKGKTGRMLAALMIVP